MSLKKQVTSGILFTALTKYSGILIGIFVTAFLSRLLTPEEFGIVGLVMVFTTFFNLLSEFGLGPAVIQSKKLNRNDLRSVFTFSVYLAVFFGLVFFLSAPLIAHFYEEPKLIRVTHFLSLAILFNALRIIPGALIMKDLKFKKAALFNIVIQILGGMLAITLAFFDFSY